MLIEIQERLLVIKKILMRYGRICRRPIRFINKLDIKMELINQIFFFFFQRDLVLINEITVKMWPLDHLA